MQYSQENKDEQERSCNRAVQEPAICLLSCQDVEKLMLITRKMLISKPNVT